ncbi:MAG: hypothetical protein C5B50_24925 [Verrucomicrobia bacterium]|nr:MAG: hypothetical protein C5B50_24925 [Verrucomicrobiota bacterium]
MQLRQPAVSAPLGHAQISRFAFFRQWLQFGLVASAFLFLIGCGKQGLSSHDSDAFKAAEPELKSKWDTAMAASQTNGYLVVYTTLQDLRAQTNLSPDQIKAVDEFLGGVGTRMYNAANKGDTEATKALKEIQANKRR